MTIHNRKEQTWEALKDPEYRRQFIAEGINVGIAFQIRALRNRQKLKQDDLANNLNKKQPLVSSWENPNYGNYSLNTLKELAKAFDVGLLVRFVSYSTLVDWTMNLTNDNIAPPSFSEEQKNLVSTSNIKVEDIKNKNIDANSYDDIINQSDKELVNA
jgi:transcriptional regulator with XRE-family HTH domain